MLNLKELTFSYNPLDWQDTFVGVRKNKDTDKFEFQLPKGFQQFPTDQFSSVKTLFFRTYKTYRKFFEEKKRLSEENQLDGFSELDNGYSLKGKDGETISYSKLNMLDAILDAYNELLILTIKNKLSRTNEVDYTKIHRYLHKAIFVDEETVFIDEMEFPKKIINTDSPTVVEMFCFIYSEIKQALEEAIESNRVKTLSNEFRERYLTHESSIFEEETFEETIAILKDILDEIDRTTPYKDSDYWHFYDAIYKFLYGENENPEDEDGNVWGISNFAVLWEELCFAEAKNRLLETQLLFADRLGVIETFNEFDSPFYLQINSHSDKRRKLRPDLVYTNFDGTIGEKYFGKIYNKQTFELRNGENLKLFPKSRNHEFYELDELYNEYLNRNPRYRNDPSDYRNKFIRAEDKDEFLARVTTYFSRFKVRDLMKKKPCIFNFDVIDYKYITEETCCTINLSEERILDIKKQLVYEFALQLNYTGGWTFSKFWIPYYFDDNEKDFVEVIGLHELFIKSKITVYKRNFLKLQELYITENE
ncbi:MAG: hypothetical protein WCY89_07225 [Flavobacteriaceae bacterium]